MSLITQQSLLMAKSDRDDALRRISVGEDTKKVRDILNGANKRIADLQKEIDDAVAKAKAQRTAAAEAKANAEAKGKKRDFKARGDRPALSEDMDLPCVSCGASFPFTGKDQMFFQTKGWKQPTRCADCREAKKTAKPSGTDLTCCDCEGTFFFSDDKALVFEEKGWEQPKRCAPCSDKHKNMKPQLINCGTCSKDFTFSVKAQKDFKEKKWPAPKTCRDCLRVKHEKKDAASVKSGSQKAAGNA